MKRRFSLNAFMHNRTASLIFSIVVAVVIWGAVVFGSPTLQERQIRVPVTVDLTGSYAESIGLCLVGDNEFSVQVQVSGRWTVISKLTEEDLRVRAEVSTINNAGKQTLTLRASRNSAEDDYEIDSILPDTISVVCDYWDTTEFSVVTNLNGTKTTDANMLGTPFLDTDMFPNGKVKISGPRSVLSKVASVQARITNPQTIEQTSVFDAELMALDADGKELDMSQCEFVDLSSLNIKVTVPVEAVRVIDFHCTVLNTPAGLAELGDKLITISPPSITVVGPLANVETFVDSVKNLTTIDFDKLKADNLTQVFSLNLPASVRVLDGTSEVSVSINVEDFSSKEFELPIGSTLKNTKLLNVPAGMQAQALSTTVKFTVIGKTSYLNRLEPKDFTAELTLPDGATAGNHPCSLRIRITDKRYDDFKNMWVYYGDGISCVVTLQ
ncbi:MAG: hypothetical protein E7534_01580 [Ruminococcaceae bacterium]|nr:hypothetical protein [Oscillospiraceae bacterium]